MKAKQEFIHKQEELAVWIEAGGKVVMKRVWELSPSRNKFCCGGKPAFPHGNWCWDESSAFLSIRQVTARAQWLVLSVDLFLFFIIPPKMWVRRRITAGTTGDLENRI